MTRSPATSPRRRWVLSLVTVGAILICLTFAPRLALSQVPPVVGFYEGSSTNTVFGCSTPINNRTTIGSGFIDITNQQNENFSGDGDFSAEITGVTIREILTLSGVVNSFGSFNGTANSEAFVDGTPAGSGSAPFTGGVSGSELSIQFPGGPLGIDNCSQSGALIEVSTQPLILTGNEVFDCSGPLNVVLQVQDMATFNAQSGCDVLGGIIENQGTANFFSGSRILQDLEILGDSTVTILGGAFGNDIEPKGRSTTNIRGGFSVADFFEDPTQDAIVRIFGTCNFPPGPLPRDTVIALDCTLEDGSSYMDNIFLNNTEGVIEIVPEPSTLLLQGACLLVTFGWRRFRREIRF